VININPYGLAYKMNGVKIIADMILLFVQKHIASVILIPQHNSKYKITHKLMKQHKIRLQLIRQIKHQVKHLINIIIEANGILDVNVLVLIGYPNLLQRKIVC